MAADQGAAPPARVLVVVGVAVAAVAGSGLWVGLQYGTATALSVASSQGVGVCFAAAGIAAWRLRPRSHTGLWMLALGIVMMIGNLNNAFYIPTDVPGRGLVLLVGLPATFAQFPIAGHLFLGYPSGRLPGRAERVLVAVGFALAAVGSALLLVTRTPLPVCDDWCGRSPVQLFDDLQLHANIWSAVFATWVGLAVAAFVLLVRRYVLSTPRQRRVFGFALAAAVLTVVLFVGLGIGLVVISAEPSVTSVSGPLNVISGWMGVIAVPVAFLAGLLRERLAFAAVGDLVGKLRHVSAETVEAGLAEALRDPTLRVVFPTDGGFLDVAGRSYELPANGRRSVTQLGDPPIAVLVHDAALGDDRELFEAAGAAAWLALENARLHAEVRAQLAEVRASRQRLAAASDEARRRLERDLHDGAQQRLLSAGLALQTLRLQLGPEGTKTLADAEEELASAVRELRELATGIHPAVLTDQGLRPALLALAARSPIPVSVDGDDPGRLPVPVETAAYFCASEAATNAVKHACATSVRIRLHVDAGLLRLTISDDGVGGASLAGSGLRGLADRVAATDGRLSVYSPPGHGTRVLVELPCG